MYTNRMKNMLDLITRGTNNTQRQERASLYLLGLAKYYTCNKCEMVSVLTVCQQVKLFTPLCIYFCKHESTKGADASVS